MYNNLDIIIICHFITLEFFVCCNLVIGKFVEIQNSKVCASPTAQKFVKINILLKLKINLNTTFVVINITKNNVQSCKENKL
jgi:hypothetical protein